MSKLQRSRAATTLLLSLLGAGVSLAILGFISLQMASGNDPVLQQDPRPTVYKKITTVKKVVEPRKTIYVQDRSSGSSSGSTPSYSTPSYSTPSYSTPSGSTPSYSTPSYTPPPVVSSAS